jgi:hypothetical protein
VGITPQAASSLCKGRLKSAFKNKKIDTTHPDVIAYIRSKDGQQTQPNLQPLKKINNPPPPPQNQIVDDQLPPTDWMPGPEIAGIAQLSLADLSRRFGTAQNLKIWLEARKKIVDIEEKEIKNAKTKGELIPRLFMEQHVIAPFEGVFIKLLTDATQTVTRELFTQFQGGATIEEAEVTVEDSMSTHILAAKQHVTMSIARGLK